MINILLISFLFVSISNAKTIIASGGISGHYYTLAFQECQTKNNCEVQATSGSIQNIELLEKGKVNYAIIQSNLYTDNLHFVKQLGTEEFYIFYKNLPHRPTSFIDLMSMVGSEYSYDIQSGSFAIFQKITTIFNIPILGTQKHIHNKHQTFCERDTKLSIYNISKESLAFQQMALCGDYYKFNKQEIVELQDLFTVKDGLIVDDILLVK